MSAVDMSPKRWPQVMIDLETMGTSANAAIFEIGVVCFDLTKREMGPELLLKVDLKSAVDCGQVIEAETLAWWMERWRTEKSEVPVLVGAGRETLTGALWNLADFWRDHAAEGAEMWARGNLEAKVLEKAMDGLMPVPWKYSKVRDQRSVAAWEGLILPAMVAHGGLIDAKAQVRDLFEARDRLMKFHRKAEPDLEKGWDAYRREVKETLAMDLIPWEVMRPQLRECFAAGVRAAMEGGAR